MTIQSDLGAMLARTITKKEAMHVLTQVLEVHFSRSNMGGSMRSHEKEAWEDSRLLPFHQQGRPA